MHLEQPNVPRITSGTGISLQTSNKTLSPVVDKGRNMLMREAWGDIPLTILIVEIHCQRYKSRSLAINNYLINDILWNHAFMLLDTSQIVGIPPAKLRCQGDNNCQKPDHEYHQENTFRCPEIMIIDVGHCPVPVWNGPFNDICNYIS